MFRFRAGVVNQDFVRIGVSFVFAPVLALNRLIAGQVPHEGEALHLDPVLEKLQVAVLRPGGFIRSSVARKGFRLQSRRCPDFDRRETETRSLGGGRGGKLGPASTPR